MKKHNELISLLNEDYNLKLTGISPIFAPVRIPKNATRIVVETFENGLCKCVYVDSYNRLIAILIEK